MFLLLVLSGCQQATSTAAQAATSSGPVQGTINSQSFTTVFAVAVASRTTTGAYDVVLTGSSSTPNVSFTVGSAPQTYTVTTFGVNGLGVLAYLGGSSYASFDSGTVTVTKVDTTAKQIAGTFSAVKTTDGKNSLAGTFTATIQ